LAPDDPHRLARARPARRLFARRAAAREAAPSGGPTDGYTREAMPPADGGPEPGEALWRDRLRKIWAFLTA
jgi:hypothetical protein